MIPLKEWAEKHGKAHRTALDWAKKKKIPAKKRLYFVESVRKEQVRGYMIDPDILPPQSKPLTSKKDCAGSKASVD